MANEIIKIKDAAESQLKKTDEIIASNEAVADMISEVNDTLSEVNDTLASSFTMLSDGLQELCFITEGGFREVIDRLDLQSKTLEAIKEILERPLDTQARELRKRAEVAYLNNWYDEAEIDLLAAEKKNYQDFIVHQILGNIYYHHKNNHPKAIEYYQKAAKYASPVSKKHASNALICAGIVYYKLGRLEDSYKSTKMALELSPPKLEVTIHERVHKLLKEGKKIHAIKAYLEETGTGLKEAMDTVEAIEKGHIVNVSYKSTVLYHHARYAAKMGYMDEFKDCLRKSILKDPDYLITADRDELLSGVKGEIKQLAQDLRADEKRIVDNIIKEINSARKEGYSFRGVFGGGGIYCWFLNNYLDFVSNYYKTH